MECLNALMIQKGNNETCEVGPPRTLHLNVNLNSRYIQNPIENKRERVLVKVCYQC